MTEENSAHTADRRRPLARELLVFAAICLAMLSLVGCQSADEEDGGWDVEACEVAADCSGAAQCISGVCGESEADPGDGGPQYCDTIAIPCCDETTGEFVTNKNCDTEDGRLYCPQGTGEAFCYDAGPSPGEVPDHDGGPYPDVPHNPEDAGQVPSYPNAPGTLGPIEGMPDEPVATNVSVVADGAGVLHVALITTDGAVHYASLDQGVWITEVVAYNIGHPAEVQIKDAAIALSATGEPLVAYIREDSDEQRVVLASRDSGVWSDEVVSDEPGASYRYVGIGVHDGEAVVGWYGDQMLKVGTQTASNWSAEQLAVAEVHPWGGISFAVGGGRAHFAYCVTGRTAQAAIRHASYDLSSGQVTESLVRKASSNCGGADLKLDDADAPVIAADVDTDIYLLRPIANGWTEETLHTSRRGEQFVYPQLALDSAGTAHVFYSDINGGGVNYTVSSATRLDRYIVLSDTSGLHTDVTATFDDRVHALYESTHGGSGPVGYWHTTNAP